MTQNALQFFSYKNKEVRTTEIDGEIWFVAKDVALALEKYPVSYIPATGWNGSERIRKCCHDT